MIRLNKPLKDIISLVTKISMDPQDIGMGMLGNMVDLADRYGKDSVSYPLIGF